MGEIQEKLGKRIRELRKWRGLSQEKLAAQAGLHYTYTGAIERGERNISIGTIAKLTKALGVDLEDLFRSDEAIKKKTKIDDITELLKNRNSKEIALAERALKVILEK